ncbi:LPXTG cell wall anchor domain-containing protein [Allostreptomyces psammosilenae]|uniref:LPXTG-motif cell wall-anchored protein n=1 Tax=Allostreptomyces psammosilenae TaxID=1892865 RepID=A0A853A268_9ACTN|nr:LPXTG cell wall anchor domain-containing protein [Allostreptomyces psammosilenae]NYI08207.1 LPXTG-motif cell wall-anchored protein [Allostreptomyces psammosilenae]
MSTHRMRRVSALGGAVSAALIATGAMAAPASAHTPTVNVTCETVTVDLTYYADSGNQVKVTAGETVLADETFGASYHRTLELPTPLTAPLTVRVEVTASDDDRYDAVIERTTPQDCQDEQEEDENGAGGSDAGNDTGAGTGDDEGTPDENATTGGAGGTEEDDTDGDASPSPSASTESGASGGDTDGSGDAATPTPSVSATTTGGNSPVPATVPGETELAATGGSTSTTLMASFGAVVLAAGGALLFVARGRRAGSRG